MAVPGTVHDIIQIDTNQKAFPIYSEFRFTKPTWSVVNLRNFKLTLNNKPHGCDMKKNELPQLWIVDWFMNGAASTDSVRWDDEWKKFLTKIGQFGLSNFSKRSFSSCPHLCRALGSHHLPPPPKKRPSINKI